MSKLLQEAIIDANRVKEIAYENAKAAIEEAFQPKIQRMISTKLSEEEYGEEMPLSPEEEFPVKDDFMGEEKYIDDGQDGTPASGLKEEEELDEEFDRIIKELETNDLEEGDDGYDTKVSSSKKNITEKDDAYDQSVSKTKKHLEEMGDMDMESPSEEDDLENLELEALINKLEEEEFGTSEEDEFDVDKSPMEKGLEAENARLRAENTDAHRAVAKLKEAINEVSLLNSKLQFSSKVIRSYDLSETQQLKVLETFDRANSVREVKLIYTTIQENYRGKTAKKVVRRRRASTVNESASRTIRTVKGKPAKSQLMEGAERWQVIAGLKPIND